MKKTAIAKGSYNGGFPFSRSRPEKGIRIIHDLPIYYNPQYYIMQGCFTKDDRKKTHYKSSR